MFANQRLRRLFIMRNPDDDLRRRGQNLLAVLWILIIITLLSIPTSVIHGRVGSLINTFSALPVAMLLLWMTHRGWVNWVTMIMLTINTVSFVLTPVFGSADFSVISYYFIINIFIAGIVLSVKMIWSVLILNIAALTLTAVLAQQFPQDSPSLLTTSTNVVLLMIFATMIATLNSTTTTRTLKEVHAARAETLQANQALIESHADLERLVADRTAILSATLAEREAQAQALQEALATQERLHSLIIDLSLPIIPVRHDTLIVPLVGSLDSTRAHTLLQRVLSQIEAQRARALILDVTGLPLVDSQVAKVLLSTAEAARLLGAETTLVGIRPEVAQALVSLGVELPQLVTYATLEQALERLKREPMYAGTELRATTLTI